MKIGLDFLQDDQTFLSFKKAELILLIKDDEFSAERGWLKGKNERTGDIGAVPVDAVLILPTLIKPTNEVLVRTLICVEPCLLYCFKNVYL